MLGSAGAPLTAKFLGGRLSANFPTLMRKGRAPERDAAVCRIAARSGEKAVSAAAAGIDPVSVTTKPTASNERFMGCVSLLPACRIRGNRNHVIDIQGVHNRLH